MTGTINVGWNIKNFLKILKISIISMFINISTQKLWICLVKNEVLPKYNRFKIIYFHFY